MGLIGKQEKMKLLSVYLCIQVGVCWFVLSFETLIIANRRKGIYQYQYIKFFFTC